MIRLNVNGTQRTFAGDPEMPELWYLRDIISLTGTKFGCGIARSGEITATNGVIDQSNFHDYPVARIYEAPYQTNVHNVESETAPAGVGEPGVPPFVPALCNAIFAATAKRVRELPLSKNKLA